MRKLFNLTLLVLSIIVTSALSSVVTFAAETNLNLCESDGLLDKTTLNLTDILNQETANDTSEKIKTESVINMDTDEVSLYRNLDDDGMIWIEDETLYKMEIDQNDPIINENLGIANSFGDVIICEKNLEDIPNNEYHQIIDLFSPQNSDAGKKTSSTYLTKSDQAWDASYTFKITLSVKYSYMNDILHMKSATGTFYRAAHNGVTVKNGVLSFNASGAIYENNKFVKNGQIGKGFTSSTGKFENVPLFNANQDIHGPFLAGVNYTLNASRGVNVSIALQIV